MFNVFQRLFVAEVSPSKVIEIKNDSLSSLTVIHRDDSMLLFAPPMRSLDRNNSCYELVLQKPISVADSTSFSLYRTSNLQEAEDKFNCFLHRLPLFVKIVKGYFNVNSLQKLCDILTEQETWSVAHLIVHFNLTEYVKHEEVLQFVDYTDSKQLMTPLQLAIKCGHLEMVKLLIPLSRLDHLDINNNSVFHYAANSNKEIIQLLVAQGTDLLNHFNSDGMTPLHLACQADNLECVYAELCAGADPNRSATAKKVYNTASAISVASFVKTKDAKEIYSEDMKYGGTPLHWCGSRETLQALIKHGCDVNALNFMGRTALHMNVARDRLDCVITLLAHDAEVDVFDKFGNTPLHIAVEKRLVKIVQCLIVFGADFNLQNNNFCTPRHMVGGEPNKTEDKEILYILHSVGAERCPAEKTACPTGCNSTGTYNGIPPENHEQPEQNIHIHDMLASTLQSTVQEPTVFVDTAKEQKSQGIMDALLSVFTSKVNTQEANQRTGEQTPNSESPTSNKEQAESPASPSKSSTSFADQMAEKPYGRGRMLCLDGGGIRGLVLVQMLLEIEKMAQIPITHLFDWVAGTSTGGILALGLGCGKTTRQCMGLYLRMKEQCFKGTRPYSSEEFEAILRENLGEYNVLSDIKHPKIIVPVVMADRKPVDLHLFRNYNSASDILKLVTPVNNRRHPPPPPNEQLVWEAARATGAAPTYFRPFGQYLDGGLVANNPTLDALTEVHEYNMALQHVGREKEAVPVSIVVSLGTGLIPVQELSNIDVFRPGGLGDLFRAANGFLTISNLIIDLATDSEGRVVQRARSWCSSIGVPYFRFNPQLTEDLGMDETDDAKLTNMLWCTKAYIYANRAKVMQMIDILKGAKDNKGCKL